MFANAPLPDAVRADSHVLVENARWLVGVPLAFWTARWWSRGTDWCTRDDLSAFTFYSREGRLLVFRACDGAGAWQLHAASGEFRNARNRRASWRGFLGRDPALAGALMVALTTLDTIPPAR